MKVNAMGPKVCSVFMCAACMISAATAVVAQDGLSGPSSVSADLSQGDGLTDPQFRSDFPNGIAPGWFAWKEKLAEDGCKFNLDYLSLAMVELLFWRGRSGRWDSPVLRSLASNRARVTDIQA